MSLDTGFTGLLEADPRAKDERETRGKSIEAGGTLA
jgi:hypothetical protein